VSPPELRHPQTTPPSENRVSVPQCRDENRGSSRGARSFLNSNCLDLARHLASTIEKEQEHEEQSKMLRTLTISITNTITTLNPFNQKYLYVWDWIIAAAFTCHPHPHVDPQIGDVRERGLVLKSVAQSDGRARPKRAKASRRPLPKRIRCCDKQCEASDRHSARWSSPKQAAMGRESQRADASAQI